MPGPCGAAVAGEAGELEAVAAAQGDAAGKLPAVDEVLAPGEEAAIGGAGAGGRFGHGEDLREQERRGHLAWVSRAAFSVFAREAALPFPQ